MEENLNPDKLSDELLKKVDMHMKYQSQLNEKKMHNELVKIVGDALGSTPSRYIDASRIPLLCQSIFNIEADMKEIKNGYVKNERFSPLEQSVEKIESNLSRAVWIVLTAVILAVLSLIIISK